MALIRCPECGQEISDTVSQCVHCGARVTVCPECGAVCMGEATICSTCGYILKAEESKPVKETPPEKVTLEALRKEWAKGCSAEKTANILNIVGGVLGIAIILLCFCVCIFEKNPNKTMGFLWGILLPMDFVGAVLGLISDSLEMRAAVAFPMFLRAKGVDHLALLDENLSSFSSLLPEKAKERGETVKEWVLGEAYYASHSARSSRLAKEIWDTILSRVDTLYCCIAMTVFFKKIFVLASGAGVTDWGIIELMLKQLFTPGWIIVILVGVAIGIAVKILEKSIEKQKKTITRKWVEKNAPEHLAAYDKYVANPHMFNIAADKIMRDV